jgi:outer membrane lipoprotein SlyB
MQYLSTKLIAKQCFIALSTASLLALSACNTYRSNAYAPGDMQQVSKVDAAVVKSFRQVEASDPALGLGTTAGGLSGAVLGAQAGNGKGSAVAAVGGALAGAALGTLIQHEASKTMAYEYVLEKKNGEMISMAQAQDTPFPVGTHVLVIYGEHARIVEDKK